MFDLKLYLHQKAFLKLYLKIIHTHTHKTTLNNSNHNPKFNT